MFAIGVVLAWLSVVGRSLWAPIVAHTANNLFSSYLG
jgi:membrane protease YdiL (CAAX protease family)